MNIYEKWQETIFLENLYPDPHKYIITASGRNAVGNSTITKATYIFGPELGDVNDPDNMLQLASQATSITVKFKPPCPFSGNLTYSFTVKVTSA